MTRMPAGALPSLRETWRAAGALASKPQAFFVRARLVTASISALGLPLAPTSLLAALFLHSRLLGAVAILILAIATANMAVWRGIVIWFAFQQGYWIGWKQAPVRRLEHPGRFYWWTAAHAVSVVIPAIGAVFLAFVTLPMFTPHPH